MTIDASRLIDARIEELGDWRAIDIPQGDRIDEDALQAVVRAAVALNTASRRVK